MIESSCHCGAVRLAIASAPTELTDCNCTICRRTGGLWAYYKPSEVQVSGATDIYVHGDRTLELHRCRVCGCVTHWTPIDPTYQRMGVNARMMEPAVIAGVRVRKLDGFDTWKYLDE